MKKKGIILFLLIANVYLLIANDVKNLELINQSIASKYASYFSEASVTGQGVLTISANDSYFALLDVDKTQIFNDIASKWKTSLIIVRSVYKEEIWSWNLDKGEVMKLDQWDYNKPISTKSAITIDERANLPWFLYLGGSGSGTKGSGVLALNSNLGFFLLYNRWNFGLSGNFSGTTMDGVDGMAGTASLGLMSKVFFPSKTSRITPNLGLEYTTLSYGESSSDNSTKKFYLLAGFSWFRKKGSWDIGAKIGEDFVLTFGYTIMPKMDGAPKPKKK